MSHTGSGFASGAGRSHGRHQRERVSEVEQQAYSQGTFNSYQNDGYDDYDGDGGDDGYDDYDDGGTYSDGLNTPAGDNRRQPRGGIENSYPASSFATSRDRYWRNEEADQSAGSNYRDDDAQSDPADAYSLTSREYAYDAEWPKVWIPSRQNPWEGTCASNLVDTGNKTGLHFISLGIFEELGYTSEDMNSSDVRHIRRVEYPPYHTLGSINLNLSFQTTESHKTEQHAIQLHVVHDGLIEGYDLVFTKEPKIGLETESQGVLMMMVLDKTKESEGAWYITRSPSLY